MLVCELIKSQEVYSADIDQAVLELVQAMVARNIGAVPVLHDGILVGIFSERDLMKRVVAEQLDSRTTKVGSVMTPNPKSISPGDTVETCMQIMGEHGFRHLPVCDGQQLRGLVSLRDIMLHNLTEKDHEVRMMRAYIQASPEL